MVLRWRTYGGKYCCCYAVVQFIVLLLVTELIRPHEDGKTRILLFNQQTRNATGLIETLFKHCEHPFHKAIFCSNITFKKEGYKDGILPPLLPHDAYGFRFKE